MTYDSTADTLDHIGKVQARLEDVIEQLWIRAKMHDQSKLQEPEKSAFDRMAQKAATTVYGSDEYKAAIAELGPALAHHYEVNAHHPEHWSAPEGGEIDELRAYIGSLDLLDPARRWLSAHLATLESRANGMSLLDVIEMFCDWGAAGERYKGGSLAQSLHVNKGRFGISDQLASIFENTRKELNWK